jgi:hypothetical protein
MLQPFESVSPAGGIVSQAGPGILNNGLLPHNFFWRIFYDGTGQ